MRLPGDQARPQNTEPKRKTAIDVIHARRAPNRSSAHPASGMVAADTVPLRRVNKMRAALVAALEQQRREPEAWLPILMERWPEHHPDDVIESWALGAPNIFTDEPIGSMDAGRWERTVAFFTDVLDVPTLEPGSLYRPELLEDRRGIADAAPASTPAHRRTNCAD